MAREAVTGARVAWSAVARAAAERAAVARAAVAGAAVARAAVAAVAMAAVAMAGAALPCHSCSTLWRDPETRGAVPRAGLRRHAFAVRLAGLLLSSNEKTPPK